MRERIVFKEDDRIAVIAPHPDDECLGAAAALMCCQVIRRQRAQAECFMYEINTPFRQPTHCIDITEHLEAKRRLIRFHADQKRQEEVNISLNLFRGAQELSDPKCKYAECYLKVDAGRLQL